MFDFRNQVVPNKAFFIFFAFLQLNVLKMRLDIQCISFEDVLKIIILPYSAIFLFLHKF